MVKFACKINKFRLIIIVLNQIFIKIKKLKMKLIINISNMIVNQKTIFFLYKTIKKKN